LNAVAMAKLGERSANLLIPEMAVPRKLGDAHHPTGAARHPPDGIKTDQDLRPFAAATLR